MKTLYRVAAATVLTAGLAAGAAASPAQAAYPRGYVSDANLRSSPTTKSAVLAKIVNQEVEIICYTTGEYVQGTAKWFKAQYYSNTGFLNASVVTRQPSVGRCP